MIETKIQAPKSVGDIIPVEKVYGTPDAFEGTPMSNLLTRVQGPIGKQDAQHNDASGKGMWLTEGEGEVSVTFEFGGSYPIGEMWVWNYNQQSTTYPGLFYRGLKEVKLEHSLDGENWTELKGQGYPFKLAPATGSNQQKATNLDDENNSPIDFGGVLARYVRLSASAIPDVGNWGGYEENEKLFGLSQVNFFAGKGFAVEAAEEWTNLFHRKQGWSGSDGIYAIPFNGCDRQGTADQTKTIFMFGDTFIGSVDEATDYRISTKMINNTLGILTGAEPKEEALEFRWKQDENNEPTSNIVPNTEKTRSVEGSYYWLQDGASINGTFYCFPMIVGPNPDGPEGFAFSIHGITRVSAPIGEDGPNLDLQEQIDTSLYFTAANGKTTYFGAAIMANTEESGNPNPDGYVYIYGLQNWEKVKLVAARVKEEDFTDLDKWVFWDGESWTAEKEQVVPIAEEISCELSVSPMVGGILDGKYIAMFQESSTGNWISMYAGDTPVGPFKDPVRLHYCQEPKGGEGIYSYNAKGHPHLSKAGEMLFSYNVNTTSWAMHEKHASIYRPRFMNVREISE